MKQKIEGYWNDSENRYPQYPMPVPNVLTEEESRQIYMLIVDKQFHADKAGYRGITCSRITGEYLGNSEYRTDEWIWPADFAPHYVREHKVKPSDEFLKYIGYETES